MELTIEITEGLDQELKKLADAQLVTKEDIALGIISVYVLRKKLKGEQKPGFFGLDLTVVGQILTAVGAQLLAMAQGKKETPPE